MSVPQPTGGMGFRATSGSGDKTAWEPIGTALTARDKRFLAEAVAVEQIDAATAGTIGFQSRTWANFSLPYRDPGTASRWERRNGERLLVLRPATLWAADGTTRDAYPFGVIPRYLLTYLCTQAVQTQNPYVNIGASMREFMTKLGMHTSGADTRRVKEQAARLIGSTLTIQTTKTLPNGRRLKGEQFTIANSFNLWEPASGDVDAPEDDPDNVPEFMSDGRLIFPDTVSLSTEFYRELTAGPVPVDLRALRALSPWPMGMDIYVWLTYRMSYLKSATFVPWSSLALQFGGQYARPRAFKAAFVETLDRRVHSIYPGARYSVTENGLRLFKSDPHVRRITGMEKEA